MRNLMKLAIAGVAALGLSTAASAADWTPPGPIKLLIAFKAGGGTDTQARMIAEEIEKRKGWKIIPQQLTGKGGGVLAKAMKDMPNDGSVIGMLITDAFGYNLVAAKKKPYKTEDFTMLVSTAGFQLGIAALTSKGYKTWDDVIAAAKSGQALRFGVMSPRLADITYLISKHYGVKFNIVVVKGGKGVMNGLNAGDLDIGWGAGIQAKAVLAGDMVNLVSGMSKRLTVSPKAPTMRELGIATDGDGLFLFAAPAGIPAEARKAISDVIAEIMLDESTKVHQFVKKGYGGVVVVKGEKLDAQIAKDQETARQLLKAVAQ